jgi:hypothetical protein
MQLKESYKVHLDHLIPRLSIRYLVPKIETTDVSSHTNNSSNRVNDIHIRYNDIRGEWFEKLKKPDFQRETNAWTPFQCKEFIESVFQGQIIPSIILWKSPETRMTYILDGAHRLSVIRAWMNDDWGDKAAGYYERRDTDQIKIIANDVRSLIKASVGSFEDFKNSYNELQRLINQEKAPKKEMSEKAFKQASFYSEVIGSNSSLYAQWETGDYNSAEQSFLRINRQGQALDPWESTLIEYRKGSYSRTIMHIANGGENGHYWPKESLNEEQKRNVSNFPEIARYIYEKLFVPSFNLPIQELTVPILVAPAYFQKHIYLLELIPLLVWNQIAPDAEDQITLLQSDYQASPEEVIHNAQHILNMLNSKLDHIAGNSNNPLSLSLVPLLYWYNHRGHFLRSLLYGFVYWLFSGTDKEIRDRKLIFSAYRDKIEFILFEYKQEIAALAALSGAGLKATRSIATFFDQILLFLSENKKVNINAEIINDKVLHLTQQNRKAKSIAKDGRNFTKRDQTQSNIIELFNSSIKCHICGGIVNLKFGGIQYDHVKEFKQQKETDPLNMKPTHPFCNNNRNLIQEHKSGSKLISMPRHIQNDSSPKKQNLNQLSFWSLEEEFPQ